MRALAGREPAQIAAALAAAVQLATSLAIPLSVEQQGAINAASVAVAGFVTALVVDQERAAPMVAGVLQAILALGLSFGVALPQPVQSTIMTALTTLAAWWLRTQVWAPVPATETAHPGRHAAPSDV